MVNFKESDNEDKDPKGVPSAASGLNESVNLLIEREKGAQSQNKGKSPAVASSSSTSLAATASQYQSSYQKLLKVNNHLLPDDEGNIPKSAKMEDAKHKYNYKNGDNPKDVESSPEEEQQVGLKRFLGIFLAVAAALQFSLSALVIKILKYHPFNLGVWRFMVMACIPIPFLIHSAVKKKEKIFKDVWPFNGTSVFLVVQAMVGSNSIIFVFFGLKYLNIADSIVIGTSAPVFVTLVAFLFLGERCGLVPVFTAILALIGVAIISKPPALTGSEDFSGDTFIGVMSSFSSMILLTIHYVALRYIRTVHHALVNLFFALWGLLECIVVAYVMGVLEVPKDFREVGLIITTAFLAFFAQTCITLALKYEQAGPVALVRTSEVVFAFLWQALFLGVQPDMFSLIGAVLTMSGVAITSLRKMVMSLPDDHKCKKTFGFLLL